MLSKTEIQYLQGQKQVSQSYERKLKCLIRKNVEVLRKELPLLCKLLADNLIMSSIALNQVGEAASQSNHNGQEHYNHNIETSDSTFKCATEFSNPESNGTEIDGGKIIKNENSDELVLMVKDTSTPATEFSNVQDTGATKNSNSSNSVNIIRCSPNPSTSTPISHENLNKSIQNG